MKHRLFRTIAALALSTGVTISIPACNQASEGDRCNPSRAAAGEDECGAGLSCQQPTHCPENYCCPTSGTSSNPNCQTGCNGGDVSICLADPTQSFCADLCKKDPTQSFCMSASDGGSAGGGGGSSGASAAAGAP